MPSRVEIVQQCLDSFHHNIDFSVLWSYTADTFKAIILPESLGIKEMNKEEHKASGIKTAEKLQKYEKYETVEIYESGDKVIAHVRSLGILKDGSEWKNDAIYILTFNEEGKITYLKEFIDSLETSKIAAKLMA
ncbi:hypothetical protein DL96DRAFT_1681274 [Flagelloscypha sp. PMI_526]|nr:hypothetical protein DL96DRAFT_1681274 [Flagelloscypha sp. PMI_526]